MVPTSKHAARGLVPSAQAELWFGDKEGLCCLMKPTPTKVWAPPGCQAPSQPLGDSSEPEQIKILAPREPGGRKAPPPTATPPPEPQLAAPCCCAPRGGERPAPPVSPDPPPTLDRSENAVGVAGVEGLQSWCPSYPCSNVVNKEDSDAIFQQENKFGELGKQIKSSA